MNLKNLKELENLTASEKRLFNNLKLARYVLAGENEAIEKEYWIATDKDLIELTFEKPQSRESFIEIYGLGEKKYEVGGELFIEVILDFLNSKIVDSWVEKYYTIIEDSALILDLKRRKELIRHKKDEEMFNLLLALDETERNLFDKLYQYREITIKKTKTFRFILEDKTLIRIVENRPSSMVELISIEGFGDKCYELFGEGILKIINESY